MNLNLLFKNDDFDWRIVSLWMLFCLLSMCRYSVFRFALYPWQQLSGSLPAWEYKYTNKRPWNQVEERKGELSI
jgi:hypothetical protein